MAYIILFIVKIMVLAPISHSLIQCPDPPSSVQLSFDLESLKFAAEEYSDIFQAPLQCSPEGHGCEKQICCGGEVGCCYRDWTSGGISQCGCKAQEDSFCTRAPPLAYIRGAACEDHKSATIDLCIRKQKDGSGLSPAEAFISKISDLHPEKQQRADLINIEIGIGDTLTNLLGNTQVTQNGARNKQFLKKFTAQQLVENLERHVIDQMFSLVKEKKEQGLPYGLQ